MDAPSDAFSDTGIDYTSGLITLIGPMSPEEASRAMVANAIRCRYLSAGVPELYDLFKDALGPGIPDSSLQVPFGHGHGLSTCGLFAEHMHGLIGVNDERLFDPYAPRKATDYAVARLVDYSSRMSAWMPASTAFVREHGGLPSAGDVVIIGCHGAVEDYGGIEHELIVAKKNKDGSVWCIEAGQVDTANGGLQCVKVVARTFELVNGKLWCRTLGSTKPGRRVLGWACTAHLELRNEHTVPMGWQNA